MTTPNYRKASIYFDDETVLEVEQRGGGGSGVGGDTGLSAVNLITGESTNDALTEKDETIEEQAGTIEQQEATIETQAGTISDLEDEVAEKQATIETQAATITEQAGTIANQAEEITSLEAQLQDAVFDKLVAVRGNVINQSGVALNYLYPEIIVTSGTEHIQSVNIDEVNANSGTNRALSCRLAKTEYGSSFPRSWSFYINCDPSQVSFEQTPANVTPSSGAATLFGVSCTKITFTFNSSELAVDNNIGRVRIAAVSS